MTEKIFEIDSNVDPVVFYGVNNVNLQLVKNLFPKVKMLARGRIIKVQGSISDVESFGQSFVQLQNWCGHHNTLDEQTIIDIIKGNVSEEKKEDSLILHGVGGRPIIARTPNQLQLVKQYALNDLLFAVGPAGTGKTYTAIALAVKSLKEKKIRRIVLSRPAVEAGEKLGFLPGDMKEKIDPYLQPLYDALQDLIPSSKLKELLEDGTIQIAPLAFMRGRTLGDAVIILDEAQNTSIQQIRMFLTRMGLNSKIIVTGDCSQIDLPPSQKSGLIEALRVLKSVKGISIVEFDVRDIVRHRLVQRIVEAWSKKDAQQEGGLKNKV